MTNTAIVYGECTAGKGMNTAEEYGGGVTGLKLVLKAALSVAYRRTKQENTPVALQIVRDCLKIAATATETKEEKEVIRTYRRQVVRIIDQVEDHRDNPTISLSPVEVSIGDQVVVRGRQFAANEVVDLELNSIPIEGIEVSADNRGRFEASVTMSTDIVEPDSSTTISAQGQVSEESVSSALRILPSGSDSTSEPGGSEGPSPSETLPEPTGGDPTEAELSP